MGAIAAELGRECEAVEIPSGDRLRLPAGLRVLVKRTTRLGANIMTEDGLLARIEPKDFDAIGLEQPGEAAGHEAPAGPVRDGRVEAELREVFDPEIPVNIVELGLVYGWTVEPSNGGSRVTIRMTLTAPGCGVGELLRREIEERIGALAGVAEVEVQWVFDPPWTPARMSEAARLMLGL